MPRQGAILGMKGRQEAALRQASRYAVRHARSLVTNRFRLTEKRCALRADFSQRLASATRPGIAASGVAVCRSQEPIAAGSLPFLEPTPLRVVASASRLLLVWGP